MATYSRTVTTMTKESQSSPQIASHELGSIIVKALENINEDENKGKDNNIISEQVAKGIDHSKLIKGSDSPAKRTDEMLDLLKTDSKESKERVKTENKKRDKQDSESKTLLAKIHATNKKSHDGIAGLAKDFAEKALVWTAIVSQVAVLLKAGLISLIEKSEANRIKIMAKIHGALSTIPDKIKLSLEKVLSKVRIMGQPIFGQLSADEKKELESLEEDKDLLQYGTALNEVELSNDQLQRQQEWLQILANNNLAGTGKTLDVSQFDLSSEGGRQAYKEALLANASYDMVSKEELSRAVDEQLKDYKLAVLDNESKKDYVEFLETMGPDAQKIQRYKQLTELQNTPMTDEFFEQEEAKIKAKARTSEEEYVQQKVEEMASSKEGIKTTTYEELKKDYGNAVASAETKFEMQGRDFKIQDLNAGESWLRNEFEDWKDSWKDFGKNLSQNIGLQIVQKTETKNSLANR